MIKRLRIRFIFSAQIASTIVLIILLVSMNFWFTRGIHHRTDLKIIDIADQVPVSPGDIREFLYGSQGIENSREIYIKRTFFKNTNQEIYEIRPMNYISRGGAERLFERTEGREKGVIEHFRFISFEKDNIITTVLIDITNEIYNLNTIRMHSFFGFIICEAIIFILLNVFSDKALGPIIRNIKNQKYFIDDASHELKTPIAIISANNEIMEMTSGQNKWTESTKRQLERMNKLVNQMLNLSEYDEKDEKYLSRKDVNITSIVNKILDDMESVIINKKIKLTKTYDEFIVSVDESMTSEMIDIIIENAIKYCSEDGEIRTSIVNKYFIISNSSSPLTDEDIKNIFERFYRSDKARSRDTGGNGMGLSIAKTIADVNNISLNAEYKDEFFSMKIGKNLR